MPDGERNATRRLSVVRCISSHAATCGVGNFFEGELGVAGRGTGARCKGARGADGRIAGRAIPFSGHGQFGWDTAPAECGGVQIEGARPHCYGHGRGDAPAAVGRGSGRGPGAAGGAGAADGSTSCTEFAEGDCGGAGPLHRLRQSIIVTTRVTFLAPIFKSVKPRSCSH